MSNWKWCVTDENGNVIKGWYQDKDNSKWYYLNDEGVMQIGWIQLNGKWFYLEPQEGTSQGVCYIDCTATIDGKSYKFDSNGHMIEDSLVSDDCISFVKSYEGFFPNKYYDCVGVLTQGYGMTGSEIENLPDEISEETASNMLKDLINEKYAKVIKDDLNSKGMTLSQNEFDALVSFAYNCGIDALLNQSTLYKNIVSGVKDSDTIVANFQAWSNGGGHRIEGLYRRRTKEANIFNNADYTGNN